jgi:hypothetical protein
MGLPEELQNNNIILVMASKEKYHAEFFAILRIIDRIAAKTCYVCINEPYTFIVGSLKKNNFAVEKFFFIDTLTRKVHEPPVSDNCIFVSAPNAFTEISLGFSKAISEQHCDITLFDTLSALLVYENAHQILQFTHNLITKLRILAGRAVFIALEDDLNTELIKDLYMFVDKVIDLSKENL